MRRFFLQKGIDHLKRKKKTQPQQAAFDTSELEERKEVQEADTRKKRRKLRYRMFATANLVIITLLVWQLWMFKGHMEELNNQLTYLLDTNSTMQGDLSNLQANIQSTLEEEASLIASYSITTTDVDFNAGTYKVEVKVTPKEYTDETQATAYFGTQDYPLEMGDHEFWGNMTLSLNDSYDGNVTFLFMNGEKKSTEVLKKYIGYPHAFEDVIHGKLEKFPAYEDGKLKVEGATQYTLDGNDVFEFDSCDIVVTASGNEIYRGNLIDGTVKYSAAPKADTDGSDGDSDGGSVSPNEITGTKTPQDIINNIMEPDTETGLEEPVEVTPLTEAKGEYTIADEFEVMQGAEVQVSLQAKTKDGFTFQYVIFKGNTAAVDPEKPEDKVDGWQEAEDYLPYTYTVMDKKGGIWHK